MGNLKNKTFLLGTLIFLLTALGVWIMRYDKLCSLIPCGLIVIGVILLLVIIFCDSKKCISTEETVVVTDKNSKDFENYKESKFLFFSVKEYSIEEKQFLGFMNLEYIALPMKLQKIPRYAFACCEKLNNLKIPDSVTEIEDYAFIGCASLKEINFPKNIEKVGKSIFMDCKKLKKICIESSELQFEENSFLGCGNFSEVSLPLNLLTNPTCPNELCKTKKLKIKNIDSNDKLEDEVLKKIINIELIELDTTEENARKLFKGLKKEQVNKKLGKIKFNDSTEVKINTWLESFNEN